MPEFTDAAPQRDRKDINNVKSSSKVFDNNSKLKFNTSSNDIKSLMMANGIYDRYDMEWHKKFTRFGLIDPYNALVSTKEYIFITKPDLCLMNPTNGIIHPLLNNNTFFRDAISRYNNAARQLQLSVSEADGPFMNMLSNSLTSSLDLPGISSDMIDSAANIMGTKMSYRSTSMKSDEDLSFHLEFEDTNHLDIYMLFKMYDEYERLKWAGALEFNNDNSQRWVNYILNKVLHDQVSIYKFIVADDGSRIVYWARMTGCVPVSVPRDAFSNMDNGSPQKLTVEWKGHFVRDMDPVIIHHFNLLVKNYIVGRKDLPLYNLDTHSMDGRWASIPYIEIRDEKSTHGPTREYFLRWKV